MPVTVRSFAKLNLGLAIGGRRPDGFHELRTVYQTIALHDRLHVEVTRGSGIQISCSHPQVPTGPSNTCYGVAERVLEALKASRRVLIRIEKRLPVQGGLGAASSNAVAAMLALERCLRARLSPEQRLHIAAEVGSDLPLFLVGGAILGSGRGELVLPLADLPAIPCVLVTPAVGVSTPEAFARWDRGSPGPPAAPALTPSGASARMDGFSRALFAWLSGTPTGVPARRSGNRAEALLLDLVRTGIENDFERVVFPLYPEVREGKRALERVGARYASLSGSGSAVYGLFASDAAARRAARRLLAQGLPAVASRTLTRRQYWARLFC